MRKVNFVATAILLAAICTVPTSADINLTLKDGKGNPIQGVSCSQAGGSPAVSDGLGRLTLSNITGIFRPGRTPGSEARLSKIPLAPGEEAVITVADIQGRQVARRVLSAGGSFTVPGEDRGVYFVSVQAPKLSVQGRRVNLGRGLTFESAASYGESAPALGKASADGTIITCSKAGYPTQVYRIPNGSSLTLDFSKTVLVPLYDNATALEPDIYELNDTAFITRWSDRSRDRHAREDEFHIYDHYLTRYWENRTAAFEIIDYVPKGGNRIDIRMKMEWELAPKTEEFRAFYRGIGTVAEYIYSPNMKLVPGTRLEYTNSIDAFYELGPNMRDAVKRPLKVGDKIEMEISQFLAEVDSRGIKLEGRARYYGTAVLYIVGKGFVPWEARGVFKDLSTEREDSHPLPEHTWMGGRTTLPYQYSNEPLFRFMQMAQNLSSINGQPFVLGRRVLHTNFIDGSHDEPGNPVWDENKGKGGPHYINTTCNSCHTRNGHSLPPLPGAPLYTSVVKVGDAAGHPHPKLGSVLQPQAVGGGAEGSAKLAAWTEADGLRKPAYSFDGAAAPAHFSVRSSPRLVGMGLLEAVPESWVQEIEDPDDADKDGISGRMNIVPDPVTGLPHMGRFGWKAGKASIKHQVAAALNTDMGVMTSVLPKPDCGSEQAGCGNASGSELADSSLKHLVDYIGLLGVAARRDYKDPAALRGETLFASAGCAACHVPAAPTTPHHPKGELRGQTIHAYTDLLLHDMGPGLADNLGEGLATGSEWRTAPLWSIGLADSVSGGASYLHDGRARTVQEAILWHGGEAEKSANAFKALPAGDQDAVVRFIKSL